VVVLKLNFDLFSESLLNELQTKITQAFDIFDHESNKTVDVREVGTIVRSLGCCPSEAELHDMLADVSLIIFILVTKGSPTTAFYSNYKLLSKLSKAD
jgi:hypothetical protein